MDLGSVHIGGKPRQWRCADPWSYNGVELTIQLWDLGSVNAPPPLYTETLALVGRLWLGCAVLTRKRIATTPGHFRMILKIILKKKELSNKLQASSFKRLTAGEGYCRISLERNKYVWWCTIKKNSRRPGGDPSAGERGSGEDEKDKRWVKKKQSLRWWSGG